MNDAWTAMTRGSRCWLLATLVATALTAALPPTLEGQYFGRNKVQYDDFEFSILTTDHFDIHFYEREEEAIDDVARMSERWYERFARTFQHEFERRKPLIIYADHPDFQQTNTLRGQVGEATGGVTESLKNRVILPMTGSYADTDHVLGHELVHAFQYNIAQSRRGGGIQGLSTLPLWLIEGMAEYLSVGREDPLTAMWMRDAVLREDFPTIKQMSRERRFFPYRFGQALWAYVGGNYGDDAVIQVFRSALRTGFQPAIGQVLGVSTDTLSAQWRRSVEQAYIPLMANRTHPDSVGTKLVAPSTGSGRQNVAPSLSPNGEFLAFLSERDLFSIDLYVADAQTGEVIDKIASANADPHADAIRYVEASGTWSPDSRHFAYVVFADGDNQIVIVDVEEGDVIRRIKPRNLGAINNPAWSPDGQKLVFTGLEGGISDLYLYDLDADVMTQLTDDRHADFQPTWSPDGSTIAFSSDRGARTDFQKLTYSSFRLALLDVASRQVRVLPAFGNVRHSNPQYSPDGESLYFVSDADGFSDIYKAHFETGEIRRLTRLATGVSGITSQSPALSVARETGDLAFSVFTAAQFHIHTLPADTEGEVVRAEVVAEGPAVERGRMLPPADPDQFSRVAEYLDDADTGLPPEGTYAAADAEEYDPSLSLDFVGQPSLGVGTDRFGTQVGGGASAFFSDMLGNRFLGVAIQAQGRIQDIGGQVIYQDVSDRWNWGGAVSRIPFLQLGFDQGTDEETGLPFFSQIRRRIFISTASGQVSYPFSSTRRIEFSAGATRYSTDTEEDRFLLNQVGQVVDVRRVERPDLEFDAINLGQAGAAYIGDNALFGLTSPVRGGRFRFEAQATMGTEDFVLAVADWRKYWQPNRNLTIGLRGMHIGRYGEIEEEGIIQPLFLGFETFIRGYALESITNQECIQSARDVNGTGCPVFERLFGQRIAVANFEFRIPLLGVEQFGIFNFPFLPTELVFFQDAGLAWDEDRDPELKFSRSSGERVPVFSTGVSARFNVLGFLILEAYWAQPWQRPEKGGHFGFQIAPGW